MVASTDPISFLVLVLVVLLLLLVTRGSRRRHAVEARLLAHATGHPSAGLPRGLTPQQRSAAAAEAANGLAVAGLITERVADGSRVVVRVLDGEYVLDVGPDAITTTYVSNAGVQELGKFTGACTAVRSITRHAHQATR